MLVTNEQLTTNLVQTTFSLNLAPGVSRFETLEGRKYVVCPMVMLTEGVHAGSQGPLYYPRNELAKTPVVWNMKPVVVYHPQINGKGVSACDPTVVEAYKIGLIMNAAWDDEAAKLRAEAWVEIARANAVDERIMQAIENNTPMELSTGVFTDNEIKGGNWNGEDYVGVAKNYRPDHLALLPDKVGACSMADGAGFLVANALAHDDIRASLGASLRGRYGDDTWIADVFDTVVVYETDKKLWRLPYTTDNDVAMLGTDAPVEVKRNVQYRTMQGELIGNAEYRELPTRGDVDMTKKEMVDGLIANESTQWEEGDREALMAMNEETLKKMTPKAIAADPKDPNPAANQAAVQAAAETGAAGVAAPQPTQNAAQATAQPQQQAAPVQITLEQLPDEILAVYNHGAAALQKERDDMIATITANANNTFTKEQLEGFDPGQLAAIAKMAGAQAQPKVQVTNAPRPLFAGAATPAAPPTANQGEGDGQKPLGLPTMNFKKAEAEGAAAN